jgi:hypothetical protein
VVLVGLPINILQIQLHHFMLKSPVSYFFHKFTVIFGTAPNAFPQAEPARGWPNLNVFR